MKYRKRALSILLALTMILTFMPAMAFAETVEGISLYYRSGDTTNHKSTDGSINMLTGTSTERPSKMFATNKSVLWYELNTTSSIKNVTWSTSDAEVVAFDAKGNSTATSKGTAGTGYLQARCVKIYARGAGNANITVEYTNETGTFSDSVNVIVKDPVDPTSIGALNDINIKVGETIQLTPPSITPDNAEYKQAIWIAPNTLVTNNQKAFTGKEVGNGKYSYKITKYNGDVLSVEANIVVSEAEKKIRIGNTGYDSLEAAFTEAKAGDTIQVDEQEINITSPIAVNNVNGLITIEGGKHTSDGQGASSYTETPTINGNAFDISGQGTRLKFTNVSFNNSNGNVMTISSDGVVTLNDDLVNGNVHLNGGSISIGTRNTFNGDITADGTDTVQISRGDFGDVTYRKGSNKVLLDVNTLINGKIFGDSSPSDKKIVKITFSAKNGAWNDGTTKDQYVTLIGDKDDVLSLDNKQIPTVGGKPDEGFVEGSWDKVPSADVVIRKDTTYTYTYKDELVVAKEAAIAELDSVNMNRYSGDEKDAVEKAVSDGKVAINEATTIDAVNAALSNAKEEIAKQKTNRKKAEEKIDSLEKAKADSDKTAADTKAELDALKKSVEDEKNIEVKYAPAKVKLTKAVRGKNRITVSFRKVKKKVAGYQIRLTNTRDGKKTYITVKKSSKKTIKKTVRNLYGNTKYKVNVRAFNKVKGKRVYGKWSNTKTVKVR